MLPGEGHRSGLRHEDVGKRFSEASSCATFQARAPPSPARPLAQVLSGALLRLASCPFFTASLEDQQRQQRDGTLGRRSDHECSGGRGEPRDKRLKGSPVPL